MPSVPDNLNPAINSAFSLLLYLFDINGCLLLIGSSGGVENDVLLLEYIVNNHIMDVEWLNGEQHNGISASR
jgi:hypothetical protein